MRVVVLLGSLSLLAVFTFADESARAVTEANFVRAETDNMFAAMIENAGGTNRFFHFRKPTRLDRQTVVRMNRDVLYSGGVFDAQNGVKLTFPELPDDRYASVYIIDNDHYVVDIVHEPGVHSVKGETQFLYFIVRLQVLDPSDPAEIALINDLQDHFLVESPTGEAFPGFHWNRASLDALRTQYEQEYRQKYSNYAGMMGARGQVNEETRHLAAATAWGLLPEQEATYLSYSGDGLTESCRVATYSVPKNKGFWSITVYGGDGYMKSDNNIVNSANVQMREDGRFTVHYGSAEQCGSGADNRVDVSDGWNFLMRVYRPDASVLNGDYTIPEAVVLRRKEG